ncbi:hypothetical protein KM295_03255 [Natronomonas sp. F2-12]|jgi:hypothetical protein|uniref:Uncharacterized protein n=1 Tax=Natronomonas aquatica TaxID=2841590 RepID=A0A9R1D3N8_9EURY|nr:hypothetical protein [Natronomonas aquatica]MCQ4332519.1 hypothetical protein [Natronomonas aquatica]
MIDTKGLFEQLSTGRGADFDFGDEPTEAELREAVRKLKAEGLCGRRIVEQRLGPYFIANDTYGERELEILETVVAEEYAGTDLCVEGRSKECSRLRGGCKGSQ